MDEGVSVKALDLLRELFYQLTLLVSRISLKKGIEFGIATVCLTTGE